MNDRLPRVMLITDQDVADPVAPILEALRSPAPVKGDSPQAVYSDDVWVQLRLKTWTPPRRREAAEALVAGGARLLINSDIGLAKRLGVGVHLPEAGPRVSEVRSQLRASVPVGRSCHDALGLAQAAGQGASYATLSPLAAVPGKGEGLGLGALSRLAATSALPVFALGGVSLGDVAPLRAAGVHGVALMRLISRATDPSRVLAQLLALSR